jgi:hypothetical protein
MSHSNETRCSTGDSPVVDAVITWVDGSDPNHAQKLRTHLGSIGGEGPSSTRFANTGEIGYCVVSILKFAPWIRKIFIVTDQQTPEIANTISKTPYASKVKIIDHQEIFKGYESYLPTFNSRSIETALWRIPGISERFIYFNDDFFLIQPVSPNDFFRGEKVVLRGFWRRPLKERSRLSYKLKNFLFFLKLRKNRPYFDMHVAGQELSAVTAGLRRKYLWINHTPHPWRRSTTEQFFSENPRLFETNLSYKLRSPNQVICQYLASSLEIKNDNAIIDNSLSTLVFNKNDRSLSSVETKIKLADQDKSVAFVCVQGSVDPAKRDTIYSWLDARMGSIAELLKDASSAKSVSHQP